MEEDDHAPHLRVCTAVIPEAELVEPLAAIDDAVVGHSQRGTLGLDEVEQSVECGDGGALASADESVDIGTDGLTPPTVDEVADLSRRDATMVAKMLPLVQAR